MVREAIKALITVVGFMVLASLLGLFMAYGFAPEWCAEVAENRYNDTCWLSMCNGDYNFCTHFPFHNEDCIKIEYQCDLYPGYEESMMWYDIYGFECIHGTYMDSYTCLCVPAGTNISKPGRPQAIEAIDGVLV